MTPLDWYGLGALTLLGVVFFVVRAVPAYLTLVALLIGGFGALTWVREAGPLPAWIVMTTGLIACALGLLIVRVMLVRSVSLQLLGRLEGARTDVFDEDIRGRLDDMRAFHLIQTTEGANRLTSFGGLISAVVATSYSVLRIRS